MVGLGVVVTWVVPPTCGQPIRDEHCGQPIRDEHCGQPMRAHLGVAAAVVEGVDLPDVRVGESVPLAQLALGRVLRHDGLHAPGLRGVDIGV